MTIDVISGSRTVGSLVADTPGAARVFEELKIDYCCGGSQSLNDACMGAGVEAEDVLRRLEESILKGGEDKVYQNWSEKSLSELVEYIISTHHVFTKAELDRIEVLAAKVVSVHSQNHPELTRIQAVFQGLKEELTPHMLKEEQVLFPYILKMEEARSQHKPVPQPFFGTVKNPVRMMMMEHETAGAKLAEIRAASSDFVVPADGCASFQAFYQSLQELEADLHQHIHLENNVLFPRAVEMEAGS